MRADREHRLQPVAWMRVRLRNTWENLRASYWFIPSLMAVAAVTLASLGQSVDRSLGEARVIDLWWIYRGGPEGARTVLSAIAGSIITVAGVVFSITIAALTMASSQFGPYLLRNFMRDRGNQIVFGVFIATHLYCLLILRTIYGSEDTDPVPHLSVTFGVLLAILSLGVLIYFIHHVASSIQAPNVIASVSADLDAAADELFPEMIGEEPSDEDDNDGPVGLPPDFGSHAASVPIERSGYLGSVDPEALMSAAVEHDLLLSLEHRPGHFLVEGRTLLLAAPAERVDAAVRRRLQRAFLVGPQRTLTQDVEFAVQQLVGLAIRALSPGINDALTAMVCVDRLGSSLRRLAQRRMPSATRYDGEGRLRVVAPKVTFPGLVEAAFNQIRQNGCGQVAVAIRLLEAMAIIGDAARRKRDRAALLRQIDAIERAAGAALSDEQDRRDLSERARLARATVATMTEHTRTLG